MMSDMRTPIIVGSDKATQYILAPTQNDLVAKQDYAKGALFIFNNGLYKTTATITTGDNIIIGSGTGTNAEPNNKTIVEELKGINDPNLKLSFEPIVPTLSSGATNLKSDTYYSGLSTYYYKIGTRVEVNISVQISSGASPTNTIIFTLPEGYRPKYTIAIPATAGTAIATGSNRIVVTNTGNVIVQNITNSSRIYGHVTFDVFN